MAGQAFTSLRDTPAPPIDTGISFEKTEPLIKLLSDIELLKKQQTSLQSDVDSISQTSGELKRKLNKEIGELKTTKNKLLTQVKDLTSAVGVIKKHQQLTTEGLNKYGDEHVQFLNSLSKSLQLDTSEITKDLSKRSTELSEEMEFLSGASEYYAQYAEITEATRSQNALERIKIQEMTDTAFQATNSAKKDTATANSLLEDAKSKHKTSKLELQKAEDYRKKYETSFTDREESNKQIESELKTQQKEVIAERKGLKDKSKRLDEQLRLIKDKDQALNRKAKELGIVI